MGGGHTIGGGLTHPGSSLSSSSILAARCAAASAPPPTLLSWALRRWVRAGGWGGGSGR